jgi:hypothetical protein
MNAPLWPTILELPEDRSAQPAWLDRVLLSPDLADSIHALQQIHRRSVRDAESLPAIDEVLAGELPRFLAAGFAALSTETVAVLLQNPELLFELQELVLLSDSEHWGNVMQQGGDDGIRQEFVLRSRPSPVPAAVAPADVPPVGTARAASGGLRRVLQVTATLTAVLVGAVLLWRTIPSGWEDPPGISGSGLGTRGLFKPDTENADEYLSRMAAAVNSLLQESDLLQRPQLVAVLQKTISDCEIAIAQPHPVLSRRLLSNGQTAEAVFRARCEAWKNKLSETLAALQQGKIEVPAAAEATTDTLQKLINRLSNPRGAEGLI